MSCVNTVRNAPCSGAICMPATAPSDAVSSISACCTASGGSPCPTRYSASSDESRNDFGGRATAMFKTLSPIARNATDVLTRASASAYDPGTRLRDGARTGETVTDLQPAGEREGSAASLAAAVLDEGAARQAAQKRSREQIIFPDDLLPGVN